MSAPGPAPTLGSSADAHDRPAWPRRVVVTVVAVCWLLVFFDGLDMFVYGAVLPSVLADKGFGMSAAQGGEVGSLATFGMLIGALAAGTITDLIGRKKMLVACCVLFSLASALCAVAPGVGVFGVGRFLAGLGLGGLLPTAIAMVSEFAPDRSRNLLIGVLMTAHHAGGMAASGLGLALLPHLGWRAVFWVAVVPLVAVPVVMLRLPESLDFLVARGRLDAARREADRFGVAVPAAVERTRGGLFAGIGELFRGRLGVATLLFWLASFAGLLLVYGVSTWLPQLMRSLGYDLGSSIAFLLVINLGGIVGMLVAGRIADRFGPITVSAVWFALTAVGVYLLGTHPSLAVTYLLVFAAGVFLYSAQTMVYAAVAASFPARARGTAIGWTAGMGRFGAVFGPWMGGQLMASGRGTWGFTAFALAAVFAMVMIAAVRILLPGADRHVPEAATV